jgi:hypothetical protein
VFYVYVGLGFWEVFVVFSCEKMSVSFKRGGLLFECGKVVDLVWCV